MCFSCPSSSHSFSNFKLSYISVFNEDDHCKSLSVSHQLASSIFNFCSLWREVFVGVLIVYIKCVSPNYHFLFDQISYLSPFRYQTGGVMCVSIQNIFFQRIYVIQGIYFSFSTKNMSSFYFDIVGAKEELFYFNMLRYHKKINLVIKHLKWYEFKIIVLQMKCFVY